MGPGWHGLVQLICAGARGGGVRILLLEPCPMGLMFFSSVTSLRIHLWCDFQLLGLQLSLLRGMWLAVASCCRFVGGLMHIGFSGCKWMRLTPRHWQVSCKLLVTWQLWFWPFWSSTSLCGFARIVAKGMHAFSEYDADWNAFFKRAARNWQNKPEYSPSFKVAV